MVGGELAGRLWVTDPPAEPEPVQLRVIERFTLVVALLLLQQRHLLDVQSRLSGDPAAGDLLREGGPVRPRAVTQQPGTQPAAGRTPIRHQCRWWVVAWGVGGGRHDDNRLAGREVGRGGVTVWWVRVGWVGGGDGVGGWVVGSGVVAA